MNHWIIVPILLPLFTALILLVGARKRGPGTVRVISLLSLTLLLGVEIYLLRLASLGGVTLYALGNWPPPFGIVLQFDRLAGLMLLMTAVLALCAAGYAALGRDGPGDSLHPLTHFLLLGLNGAFLTGDLFNLFVFFEVLLLASYALLLHGGGRDRAKAGLHYVVLNLAGSALFLIAVALLYGVTGTLNMADMGERILSLNPDDRALAHTGGLLLLVVFGLKAAVAPLYFWLPSAYAVATGPVAALFAVMTKVGIYSIIRVYSLVFASAEDSFADFLSPWLWPLALLTLVLGLAGTLAARGLRQQIAYLVIVSVGTLLIAIAMNTVASLTALLYYLVHSTWICAALFLLADVLREQRGEVGDDIRGGPPLAQGTSLGILFFIAAASIVGMPPTSGFVGKLGLMQAVDSNIQALWVWPALLIAGLTSITALSRTGSTFFWRTDGEVTGHGRADKGELLIIAILVLLTIGLSFAGNWVLPYMEATAVQLVDPDSYRQAASNMQAIPGDTP